MQGNGATCGGKMYSLRITIQKTKEDRDRNRRLVRIASAM